ncbi:MAG: hypothetical protein CXX81_01940 [Methanobacteriota archaeon]|nr:MAG: hypothetical protein CXX81_15375 [Euryarchaeota archaeon]PXY79628.1 MAG: hypothetical protein CXX81_01940 [Euryarchaeota archaeon]
MAEKKRFLSLTNAEIIFLACWVIWLLAWLKELPIHRHDFNTAQWMLHSWWFLEEPLPTCAGISRLSCWYYPTHPPLVHLFGIPGLVLFGWVTWPIRLLQAMIILWGAFELRALAQRIATPAAGSMVLFIFLASPMLILYGAIPNYEPTVVALLCALMNRTSLYLDDKKISGIICVYAIATLGMLTDWSAYHPVGIAFLIAWYGHLKGTESKWVQVAAEHRWHLTTLFAIGVLIFSSHLYTVYHAYGSLDPIFSTAELRSISFSLAGSRLDGLSYLSKPVIMIGVFLGIILEQFLTMASAWIVLLLTRKKNFPVSTTSVGKWILIPMSAGLIHTLMFPQGAFIHEYWVAPLLPPFALVVAVKASNWTENQVNTCGKVACAMLLLWGLVLLPITSVAYIEDSVESVENLHEIFGDDASILVSYEIISARPEVVMSLHTGNLTPTAWASDSQEDWNWDGAVLCADNAWVEKLTSANQNYTIIDQRPSPACPTEQLVVLVPSNQSA